MTKKEIKEYYEFHGKDYKLKECECDNTHTENESVCRFCYEQKSGQTK